MEEQIFKVQDSNILIISELQNKVFLPYKKEEIIKILEENQNQYKTVEEVIEKLYIIPLTQYKHKRISRFKETYFFMRNKEKSSWIDAVFLALELMMKKYIHPAIITACTCLDQLDVYLDCLETNELEDFPFFEIKYELL